VDATIFGTHINRRLVVERTLSVGSNPETTVDDNIYICYLTRLTRNFFCNRLPLTYTQEHSMINGVYLM